MFFQNIGFASILLYFAYALLLFGIAKHLYINRISITLYCYVILALLLVGLLLQNMSFERKLPLMFSVLMIWFCAVIPKGYLTGGKALKEIAYAIWAALIVSFYLAVIFHYPIIDTLSENNFEWGFNGGILYKNYFASDVLTIYICSFLYRKYCTRNKKLSFGEILSIFFIIVSFSKGCWILWMLFILCMNLDKLRRIKKNERRFVLLCVLLLLSILFYIGFTKFAMRSATFMYRVRGWTNYTRYYSSDIFHMLFGNAETVFSSNMSYVDTVRSIVGWDGTLEMAWLNILIKNGVLGLIAFVMIFVRYFYTGVNNKTISNLETYISITVTLLVSGFVEIYIQSLHNPFGVFCYLLLTGMECGNLKKGLVKYENGKCDHEHI